MDQDERRIRSLKLRGPDESLLLQLRYGLEEAFRIASLPGLPPNAAVLIRHLDLGTVRSDLPAVQLADRISETLRALAAEAVCIDQESGKDSNVVWFSDPLQPYQVLLQRLLDGRAAVEWYWRSLFPDQELSLNQQMITELLIKACQTPAESLAVALLIQSCLEPSRLFRLLPFVTPTLVHRLLHAQGMSPAALSGTPAQKPHNQASISPDTGPVRLIEAPDLNMAWRSALHTAVQYWGHKDVRSRWLVLQALLCYRPTYLERRDTWHGIDLIHWFEVWSMTLPDAGDEKNSSSEHLALLNSPDVVRDKAQAPVSNKAGAGLCNEPASSPQAEEFESTCVPSKTDVQRDPGGEAGIEASPGQFSTHAGFAFLIPLSQRLGMADLLQHQDTLLAVDFPRQMLWRMATRFVLEDDPCWRLFTDIEATPDAIFDRYDAPPPWWRLVQESRRSPRYIPLQAPALRVDDLINSFQLACALYLRRHCDLSLRGLIHRPGRVALSRTHWDVVFDINRTDLRLRRVALDSDPGWVPWLGRVLRFHYDSAGLGHV